MTKETEGVYDENEHTVDLDVSTDFDVEIADDTPEEDRGRPRMAENEEPEIPDDAELESYSASVQKRLKKMTYQINEQRRQKEEAARLREEAIKYAEAVRFENDRLRKSLEDGEGLLINQAKARLEAQMEKAKASYKAAYEMGDPDAIIAAQEQWSALQNESFRINSYKPQPRPAPAAPQPQRPVVPQPDAQAQQWVQKNSWFGKDEEMTGYAFGVHERLAKSGVDTNSKEYYNQLDAAIRKRFADKFGDTEVEVKSPARQTGNVVAPASRSVKNPRKVTITSSAASIAKRLGLTPEQYAAQVLKDMSNG